MLKNKKVNRFLVFSNFTKNNSTRLLLSCILLQNISILIKSILFVCIILIIVAF